MDILTLQSGIFYLIFIIASLSSTFVERAMCISFKRLVKKYLDLYLETTHLHTPLFLQKSTVLRCVTTAFRIFSYCYIYKSLFDTPFPAYMKNMFSLRSSSYDLRGKYILSLSRPKTTAYGLNSFSYFSSNQWKTLLDFFALVLFEDFKTVWNTRVQVCLYVDFLLVYTSKY